MDSLTLFLNALSRTYVPELLRLHARPDLDHQRRPVVIQGHDALVARVIRSDGSRLALRVAISPDGGRDWHLRYHALASGVPEGMLPYLPRAIDVLPGGFTMGEATYEAVVTEWVDGPTLLQATDRAGRAGNSAVLRALASSLRDLAVAIRQARVVHGDLAADNLMMRPNGDLVCIDLDTMTWPGAQLGAAGHGSPPYRHPSGTGSVAERDAFGVLVMYTSLRVLADDPDLRRNYGDPISEHGGALLFSAWDLADPGTSKAFADARERVGPEARRLVDRLQDACVGRPGRAPDILAEVLALPKASPEMPADEPPAAMSSWDLTAVIERLKTQYGATRAPERPVPPPEPEPEGWTTPAAAWSPPEERTVRMPVAAPGVALAEERERLRQAITAGDEAEVVRLAARLGDDPIAQMYKLDVERVLVAGYQQRIAQAAERRQDDLVLSLAEEIAQRRLPVNAATRATVRRVRERIDVRRRLEAALAADDRATLTHMAVSGELVVLGDTDRASLQKVLRALEWPALQRALSTDDDALILEWYDDELFGEAEVLPEDARRRIALAEERTAWLQEVRSALKMRRVRDLSSLFLSPPDGAVERLTPSERRRAARLIERQAAIDELQLAMRSGDDNAVLSALNTIDRVGARIEDRFTWLAVQGVVQRATVIEDIVAAATAVPVDDRQLAHLLPVAKTMGLAHDPRLQGDLAFERLEQLVVRGAAVRRIRRALAKDDDGAIRQAAWPDVADAHAALTEAERMRVEAALARTMPRRAASG